MGDQKERCSRTSMPAASSTPGSEAWRNTNFSRDGLTEELRSRKCCFGQGFFEADLMAMVPRPPEGPGSRRSFKAAGPPRFRRSEPYGRDLGPASHPGDPLLLCTSRGSRVEGPRRGSHPLDGLQRGPRGAQATPARTAGEGDSEKSRLETDLGIPKPTLKSHRGSSGPSPSDPLRNMLPQNGIFSSVAPLWTYFVEKM